MKVIANNKKVYHDYFIEDTLEAGIELFGYEVKSLRQNKCSIKESYISIKNNEVFIIGMNITPFENINTFYSVDCLRTRKLLLHKKEIEKLIGLTTIKGMTLVPTKVYFRNSRIKVEIGVAKGKKKYDKREDLKKKDAQRKIDRSIKERI